MKNDVQSVQLVQVKIQPESHHVLQMREFFEQNPYWERDVWDIRDEDFPLDTSKHKVLTKRINFGQLTNPYVKFEIKYYLAFRLMDETLSLSSVLGYNPALKQLVGFIDDKLPTIRSIVEIPFDKALMLYRTYLISKGKKIELEIEKDGQTYETHSPYITFFKQMYEFLYYDFYDDREETEKDIWDVRKLGIKYNVSKANYKLNFTFIPNSFREVVKKYFKLRVVTQQNLSFLKAANDWIPAFKKFFSFLINKYPMVTCFKSLARQDIVEFINHLRNSTMIYGRGSKVNPMSDYRISVTLNCLFVFLEDIQRYEWDEAPVKHSHLLIFTEDKPKLEKTDKDDQIKFVPDHVWEQLVKAIEESGAKGRLEAEYIPILLVMEASGFRGSDVLGLKVDCLKMGKDDKWWLVGDQRKVNYKDHKVPISDEIAAVIMAQQGLTKEQSTPENNPDNYLFVRFTGKRKDKPIDAGTFNKALNRFAKKANIRDEQGNPYHFNNHAFRHRYGVTMINNGMNILHVQKLMCHTSPEMTLRYAKLLDNTLREEWLKARQGATVLTGVSLDAKGNIVKTEMEQQAVENGIELAWIRHNLDAIRLDHGLCIKSPKTSCSFLEQLVEPPCIANKCRSFHVDNTFASYYKSQIEQLETDIQIHKEQGRIRSVELNEKKLNRYKEIYNEITDNGGVFGTPKERREYVGEERKKVVANG